MSAGCKSSHSGFLDVSCSNGGLRILGSIGELSCLTIFSTSLSVAAFLRRAGGSMLESTGSHGRGVERRLPEMKSMVEFTCKVLHIDLTCVSWVWSDWGAVKTTTRKCYVAYPPAPSSRTLIYHQGHFLAILFVISMCRLIFRSLIETPGWHCRWSWMIFESHFM